MYDGKKLRELCKDFTVLLVDDEDGAREQIYNILILIFKEVFTAKNGKDALNIYKENSIDLIITDITMPVMGGFELLDLVREINQNQKVIVMSAHTEIDMIIQAIRLSVDGYILKPIEANQTFEAIEKAASNIKLELENIAYQKSLEDKVDSQEKLLIQQLEYDSLTGLPNKEKLYLEFKENASDYSDMIMLNIDNFSQINATYGYLDGDLA
ncbi:MAG: response regulator, partial [Campylobacterales bacterium]